MELGAGAADAGNLFVITGGPGSGKSTLVGALRDAGYCGSDEVGRQIIKDQMSISGRALPWIDPALFAEMMLSWELRTYGALAARPGPVFFDRGIPDVLGYLRLNDLPVPSHMEEAAALFRYSRRVFIAPPWPEIFAPDSERKQTVEEAERTYHAMVSTYSDCDYELVVLPRSSVEDRLRFIVGTLG